MYLLTGTILLLPLARAQEPQTVDNLAQRLAKAYKPPVEFAGDGGKYRAPLLSPDGQRVQSAEDWSRRRAEIFKTWHRRLGGWPPLVEKPTVERIESVEKQGYVQHLVRVQISQRSQTVEGYLLVPVGDGPFPAVFVPFYEPLTSIGQGKKGQGTHDYGQERLPRSLRRGPEVRCGAGGPVCRAALSHMQRGWMCGLLCTARMTIRQYSIKPYLPRRRQGG